MYFIIRIFVITNEMNLNLMPRTTQTFLNKNSISFIEERSEKWNFGAFGRMNQPIRYRENNFCPTKISF